MAGRGMWKWTGALRTVLVSVLVFGLTMSTPRAWGQGEASIEGNVTDASGSAVGGVSITVKNEDTGAVRTVETDGGGHYAAPLLPVGNYDATALKAGFESQTKAKIALTLGQQATVDFALSLSGLNETVQVTAQTPGVTATTADDSGLVGEQEVKELPLNKRSYDQLLTLNPGVVNYSSQRAGGVGTSNSVVGNIFSASGHRPQDNLYLLNGVEYTSASEIDNTPGGVSGQLLGVDAVREFSEVTDTYGAEYGKRAGAQINIATASGSNQLHGTVFDFVRDSALDAKNFFDYLGKPPLSLNDFGGALGGPIKKDKAFFFVNYEGFREQDGLSDLTLVPDASSRAKAVASVQPYLALWPVANGPTLLTSTGADSGIGEAFSNPTQTLREDFATARYDESFSANDSVAAVYTFDDGSANTPTSDPFSIDNLLSREQVVSANWTHVFSSTVVNNGTFGFSRGSFYFNSGVTADLPGWVNSGDPVGTLVVGGGTTLNGASQISNGGTNAGSNLKAVRNVFTISDQVSVTKGKQVFSFGVWLEPLQANDQLVQDQYGQASFTSLSTFLAGSVSTYTFAPSYTPLNWQSIEAAFFVEDVIKITPNLEVRLGFRGESSSGWDEAHDRASNYQYGPGTPFGVIQTQPAVGNSALATNNALFLPEPRASIAWSPFGNRSKTVIRAAYGRYHDLLDALSYRLDQDAPYNTVYAVKSISLANVPTTTSSSPGVFVVPSGVQPNLQTPTVESWSLRIEQELFKGTTLSIGYVGNHGDHELLSADTNLPAAAYPYPTQVTTATSTGLTNPQLWNSTVWLSEGISNYNALQVDVSRRVGHSLTFRGVYTLAHSLDDGDNMNTSVATNSPAFLENPLQPLWDYGRASFDVRHAGVINATYELPLWRGSAGVVREVLGGWQVSGIETIESGLPFTPQMSYNPSNDGDTRNPVRPDWNPAFTGSLYTGNPNEWFNPAAFIQPASGHYGNVGRNVLQGPGLATLDFSLRKNFVLTERFNLQFRSEFFNLFNRVNFNTPNPVVFTAAGTAGDSVTAGVITSTTTPARQIQLGLKLLW